MTERTVRKWLDGPISLDGAALPFTPVSETLWRAQTRVEATPVDVDLVLWGDGGAELSVHPTRRPLITWGARREGRYFDKVHDLTASVAESLVHRLARRTDRRFRAATRENAKVCLSLRPSTLRKWSESPESAGCS